MWRSITGRVVLVVLAWLVPFVAITAFAGVVVYRDRIAAEQDANLELARAAANAFEGFVRDVLRQEQVLGEAVVAQRPDSGVVQSLLSRAEVEYVSVRDFSWAAPDGRVLASSDRRLLGTSAAGQGWHRRIAEGADSAVSDVYAAPSDGHPTVAIVRAIRDVTGLRGVVHASIDATRLGELALSFERLGRADIALADHAGRIVFRRAGEGGPAGGVLDTGAVARALEGEEVATARRGGAITAAVPVELVGWAAIASRSYRDAAAPFLGAIARAIGVGIAAAALAALASVLVTRRIARALRRLERHVQELGRGGHAVLAPLAGPGEIVRLGTAFDEMAGKLVAANASLMLHERLFETSPDPMIVLDRGLRLRAVNPAYAAMRGVSTADLLGRPLVEVAGLDAFDAMVPRIERAFSGESVQYELWTDLPAGRRCLEASYHPVRERERERLEHVGVRFRDVTDRRHAEATASQSLASAEAERRRFEAVFREAPAGIVIFDGRSLRARWSNRTFLSFLDAPFAQLGIEGLRIEDFVPNAREAELDEVVGRVAATGRPAEAPEYRHDGFARGAAWWRWSVRAIPGEAGPDVLLLVTEVTEQVHARKVAEDEKLRLETILRTLPVGVILAGPDGRILSANDHARQIWGGDAAVPDAYRGAWAGTGVPLAPGDWAIQRAVDRGETSTGELIDIERFDGGRATILNNAAPIRDASGRIVGAVAAFHDVSETRRAQREAEDAVRHRDEVLAIVSHDLRTPLSAIVMGARVLGGHASADPERVRATAARIATAAERMARLIGDLLDLASLERGRLSMKRAALAPATLAREAAEVIRPAAEAKGLEVHWRAPEDLPLVSCDHDRILQVLGNLTSNAVKATAAGHVAIAARAAEDLVVFEVQDTGPGIPAEELPHVFDRFRRGRSAGYAGTGLGLAIARGLIEAHGGRIWAESAPTSGTIVRFALPVAASPAEQAADVA